MKPLQSAKQPPPPRELINSIGLGEHETKSAHCPFCDRLNRSSDVYVTGSNDWAWKCHAACGGDRSVAAQPEFATLPDARRLFGISRSTFYELERLNRIRLVRIRKPGNILGRVLVDCSSVRRFLASSEDCR